MCSDVCPQAQHPVYWGTNTVPLIVTKVSDYLYHWDSALLSQLSCPRVSLTDRC